MDKMEQSIWMYLDGALSEDESLLYRQRISSDPTFKQRVDRIKSLHSRLSSLDAMTAPDTLLENVMVGIQKQKKVYAKANFSGLVKFLIGLTIAMITVSLFFIFNSTPQAMSSSLDAPLLAEATDWVAKGTRFMTGFLPSAKALPIVLGCFALMMVFWLDMLGQNMKVSRNRI